MFGKSPLKQNSKIALDKKVTRIFSQKNQIAGTYK